MKNTTVSNAYASFAPLYDLFFGRVLAPGRRAAIRTLDLPEGAGVLEVGVGTGLSLPLYPPHLRITGIDLSPEMLDRARQRVRDHHLDSIEALHLMNAQEMSFEADRFDAVIAMYVVSVADDPVRLVHEMKRVCRPGGTLIIVNHFETSSRMIRAAELLLKPIHRRVRFRADLNLDRFVRDAGLHVESTSRSNIFGYSTILRCRNS